ncbi:SURF1 family protein [Asticcacaulis excentricus]|uniref:SURF1-like protein n=1 Tax=Asticcacaulis excentricus (strain ATCC 15261 / DSM 4724 / KCTC 12464 / NCIMB 9791 / VKM B-1370 / CB 48) TaxID=573065 RepID=E8RV67_ASTEC|nr:SURF1 family protein [Asticcacaulis excentricus]ADU14267.1 Surfeit locus 1 family protein [Asticcacaulis excentricus CB 48]
MKRLPVGLSIAVGVALLILLGLGTWQMQRLHWKTQLLTDLARTRAIAPVALDGLLSQPGDHVWRQVTLDCRSDSRDLVYMYGVSDGVAGFHVLTHCPTGQGVILADLGFTAQKPLADAVATITLTGRLRRFETPNAFVPPNNPKADDWYSRSVPDLSKRWSVTLRRDYFVAATQPVAPDLTPVDAAANLSNRHLEYALTWYGLAVALIGVYIALLYSRRRAEMRKGRS